MGLLLTVVSVAAVSVLAITVTVLVRGLREQALQRHRHHERRSRRDRIRQENDDWVEQTLEFCAEVRRTKCSPELMPRQR